MKPPATLIPKLPGVRRRAVSRHGHSRRLIAPTGRPPCAAGGDAPPMARETARPPRLRLERAGEENQPPIATCACALCRAKTDQRMRDGLVTERE
jgi:hypothetical protein